MDPFIGEIRTFPWSFAPKGWALCNGALLPIQQNQALFALLGVIYGGDGRTTFALPDLRGRAPIHVGTGGGQTYAMGNKGGTETVPLTVDNLPAHNHAMVALSGTPGDVTGASGSLSAKVGAVLSSGETLYIYTTNIGSTVQLASDSVGSSGSSAGHNNMQPYLVLNFCIATTGLYPPRS